MMREIVFELINGNPYYDKQNKPKRKDQLYKFSIDPEPEIKKAPTKKEINKFENKLKK